MFTFLVTPDGGDAFEVAVGSRDIVVWEKSGPGRSITKLMEDLKATDMYAIAHISAKRQQLFTGSLAEFEQTCEIDSRSMFDVVEEPDPTQQGPSVGPSSPSPSTPASNPRSGRGKKNG